MADSFLYVDSNNGEIPYNKRSEIVAQGSWKRASGGFVFDPISFKVLCHKGSNQKSRRPKKWVCTVGGKANQGESPRQTAKRELFEEYELRVLEKNINYLGLIRSDERKQFESIFIFLCSERLFDKQICNSEIDEVSWIEIETIIMNLRNNIDWYQYGFEFHFFCKILTSLKSGEVFQVMNHLRFNLIFEYLSNQDCSIKNGAILEDSDIVLSYVI